MPDTYRFPFPPNPTGWFLVCESKELAAGEVQPVRYFGQDFVLFRTEAGRPVLLDAFCPHLGAHLGYGGKVEGECIRCPFHDWRFDSSGACSQVPYKRTEGLPDAPIATRTLHETSGLILVWHSDHGHAPDWFIPDQPNWGQPGWVGYETKRWQVRTHVQEVTENIPDTSHFVAVHGFPAVPEARVETKDHIFTQVMGDDTFSLQQVAYGLGLTWIDVDFAVPYRLLVAATPVDEQFVDLRLLFLVHEGEGAAELSANGRSAVNLISNNTGRDVEIWTHKIFRERPMLVAGDGAIGVYRKWAKQFYESEALR